MPVVFIGCALGIVRRHHTSPERAPLAVVISIYYNTCFLKLLQFKIPGGYSHSAGCHRPPMVMCRPAAALVGFPLAVLGWLWTLPAIYMHIYMHIYEHQRLYMDVTGYQYPALL